MDGVALELELSSVFCCVVVCVCVVLCVCVVGCVCGGVPPCRLPAKLTALHSARLCGLFGGLRSRGRRNFTINKYLFYVQFTDITYRTVVSYKALVPISTFKAL
jgi:hypothetical protein